MYVATLPNTHMYICIHVCRLLVVFLSICLIITYSIRICAFYYMQSSEEGTGGVSVSEQLLMNTEQVGILVISTLNTSNNETVKTISNPNIG